jgi:hypothetical protein
MRALIKCADDFHPAWVKAMVNGEEATVEAALSNSGELEGQTIP